MFVLCALLAFSPAVPPSASRAPSPTDTSAKPSAISELHHRPALDYSLTIAFGAVGILGEALSAKIAPRRCRWCSVEASPLDRLSRSTLRWHRPDSASTLSHVTAFAALPLGATGLVLAGLAPERAWRLFPRDLLYVVEAVAIDLALTEGIKYATARQRPFAHFVPPQSGPPPFEEESDQNLSFPSGHTSIAFSIAVASGTVASMRGYRTAPLIWGAGLSLASLTGYLRIAGDRHYMSDVVVGAVLGSSVGFAIPWLLHRPLTSESKNSVYLRITPYPGGAAMSMRW